MSFLYPGFLFALVALAIPVIIHLFNFRKFKTVYFSNVRFLREIKEETASRSKLKHLLILIARLLALTFLVFAFAQPFISREETKVVAGSQAISVYIDNSFSMDAIGNKVPLLDQAKEYAANIASEYGPEDRFQLLTNDFEGKHQRLVSKEIFLKYLDEIEISPAVKILDQVKERQLQALEGEGNASMYMISDFQQNISKLELDTTIRIFLIPVKAIAKNNISIDSVWLASPVQMINESNLLYCRLANRGSEDVSNISITLSINGQTKALEVASLSANSTLDDTLSFSVNNSGWHHAELSITDYPINFDDKYYFTFHVPDHISILVIGQETSDPYFAALQSQDFLTIEHSPVGLINYGELKNHRLIILNQPHQLSSGLQDALANFVYEGGNLLVFPGSESNLQDYNNLLLELGAGTYSGLVNKKQSVTFIDIEQGLFRDVFDEIPRNILLPVVEKFFSIESKTRSAEEVIIRMLDGHSLLSQFKSGQGSVYLCAVPPDLTYSDLPKHTLFVVMVVQIAIKGKHTGRMANTIGIDQYIELEKVATGPDQVYKLRQNNLEYVVQPTGNKILLGSNQSAGIDIRDAGIFELYTGDSIYTSWHAFNFDRRESDISTYSAATLEDLFPGNNISVLNTGDGSLSGLIGEINEGVPLWKLCIIFALIFLATEVLLLRFLPE